MLDFLRLLKRRYQIVLDHNQITASGKLAAKQSLRSLILSESYLEKGQSIEAHTNLALQIAVVGPTQAGKSTVVNLLLQNEFAVVSPLAGFTTFPQGFSVGIGDQDRLSVKNFYHNYQRVNPNDTVTDPGTVFALHEVSVKKHPQLSDCIIWDTPDFDSIHSARYYENLLRTIAFADVVLLVVSKDKYADQSVWKLLSLIEPLQQPTVVCINKIQQQNSPVVIQSFSEKWRKSRSDSMPQAVSLPFVNENMATLYSGPEFQNIVETLQQALSTVDRSKHRSNSSVLLNRYWSDWTEGIKEEHFLLSEWGQLIEATSTSAIELYQRHYLNHPQHFETLKRALAELLSLLEIPGIAPVFAKTREILTWPVRQLLDIGKKPPGDNDQELLNSQENQVLERMFEHFMIQISNAAIKKCGTSENSQQWWKEISTLITLENQSLSDRYHRSVRDYQQQFQPEVKEAANRLYKKLEQQPATLNSLRATRITTDAAAVTVALKTGGIGIQDFVITPAVLALTSFLTESALGHYMSRIEAELKEKQLNAVSSLLFEDGLCRHLKHLPENMTQSNKLNISEESLRDAEAKLEAL